MTDPADRFLEEKLHALARGVSVPLVPTEDDVRRGRRRLFRMRVAMAGATTAAVAIVLGVTSLTAGDPKATEPPLVTTRRAPCPRRRPARRPPTAATDDEPGGGQQAGTGGNQDGRRPGRRPRQPAHGRREVPAKNATNGTGDGHRRAPPRTTGPAPGRMTSPTGTHGSDPTEAPSSR